MTKWNADGDGHDRNAIIAGVVVGGLMARYGYPVTGVASTAQIIIWGLLFSPDLDLSDTGRKQGGGCKAWHRWKRMGLGWFWKPYGRAIGHRSIKSHSLIPGTLIRFFYSLSIPLILGTVWIIKYGVPEFLLIENLGWNTLKRLTIMLLVTLANCMIADAVHLIRDGIAIKEWFN
jgi:uncharacterized metal-binding protein